jgi:hypothetical protein
VTIQIVQRHPFAGAMYPPTIGPKTGPPTPKENLCESSIRQSKKITHNHVPKNPQMQIPYATRAGSNMSVIVAPPVARQGLPKNPVNSRKTRNIGMLTAKPVGSCNRTNARIVQKYTPPRPSVGISDIGLQSIGPSPYPLTGAEDKRQ